MGMIWDPALREREGEESVTAVPAFSRSLNGALTEGVTDVASGLVSAGGDGASQRALPPTPSVSALSGEEPWRIGVLLGSHPCAFVPATGPGASSPLSALDDAADSLVGALSGSPAAWASFQDDDGLGTAASSSAPALSPGVELSRLPLWGALPFMAVLDAVRTRP